MVAKTKKTRVRPVDSERSHARPGGSTKATRRKSKAGSGDCRLDAVIPNAAPANNKARGPRCEDGTTVASTAGGVTSIANEATCAAPAKSNGRAMVGLKPVSRLHGSDGGGELSAGNGLFAASARPNKRGDHVLGNAGDHASHAADGGGAVNGNDSGIASVCLQLQQLQRRRSAAIKVKNMGLNQLAAIVSTAMGYRAGMTKEERQEKRAEAEKLIKQVDAGVASSDSGTPVAGIILLSRDSRKGMETYIADLEREMLALAKQLPVAAWFEHPDRRGIGLLSLATIVGETGDLSNYAGPAKLWKRMGCAPITSSGGETKMGSTWKMKGGLTAEEWTEAGYSPRKRSIMYVVGENIVKQNQEGPYRKHYDAAKASRPEWEKIRAHRHGMLLAVKLLLKDLWVEWRRAAT